MKEKGMMNDDKKKGLCRLSRTPFHNRGHPCLQLNSRRQKNSMDSALQSVAYLASNLVRHED